MVRYKDWTEMIENWKCPWVFFLFLKHLNIIIRRQVKLIYKILLNVALKLEIMYVNDYIFSQ